jgi:hypothetical protein
MLALIADAARACAHRAEEYPMKSIRTKYEKSSHRGKVIQKICAILNEDRNNDDGNIFISATNIESCRAAKKT